jgi:Fic-DOC domain mobile mystery protein B
MGLEYNYIQGQTPLDDEEKDGLLIKNISTQGELNEAEQINIQKAIGWTLNKKIKSSEILEEMFIRELHQKMFGNVWRWAGHFRKSNKNIGVDKYQISLELKNLLEDAKFWSNNQTFSPQEIAIRFKHRIVSIHCFTNGNGRHSRLIADVIISHLYNEKVFTWSHGDLVNAGSGRLNYLDALRKADKHDYQPLLDFARSGMKEFSI